jgi:hypothetical protein
MIIKAARERGEPIPQHILNRPEPWHIARPYWNCLETLGRSRQLVSTGMSVQYMPLAWTEIAAWAEKHEHATTVEDLDDFVEIVQRADGEWLKVNQIKKKSPRK